MMGHNYFFTGNLFGLGLNGGVRGEGVGYVGDRLTLSLGM